jgi:hydroxymethylbilane synthase
MVQTRHVEQLLKRAFPNLRVEIQEGVNALGDRELGESLKTLAAKTPGLFTKELEAGLLDGQYDAVVHSLKDMPTQLPAGLSLAAITEREDPRDALVVNAKHKGKGGLASLPAGAIIGTSSIRREAALRRDFPRLQIRLIRGNVNTRLAKLDAGEYDAILLAVAGLRRLGPSFAARIEQVLEPPRFLYGVGQGALGLQCRSKDDRIVRILRLAANHAETSARCRAERALLRALQGGCQIPLGVSSVVHPGTEPGEEDHLTLTCDILAEDGSASVLKTVVGPVSQPETVGETLARSLLTGGGGKLIERFRGAGAASATPRPTTYGSAEMPNLAARPKTVALPEHSP